MEKFNIIVVYTQDRTYICQEGDDIRKTLISVYGEKLGNEAFHAVSKAPYGSMYRKDGGPLVQVVDNDMAEKIREKERSNGMMI